MVSHYSKSIQNAILMELFKAEHSIKIAVAWFTNELLFQSLVMKVKSGITVELILNKDDINCSENNPIDFNDFVNSGGILYWNTSQQLLHNKFCIIDDKLVISGSYNWTNNAERNEESISISKEDIDTLTFFKDNFDHLKKRFQVEMLSAPSSNKIYEVKSHKISLVWFDKINLGDTFDTVQDGEYLYFVDKNFQHKYPSVGFQQIVKAIHPSDAIIQINNKWGIYDWDNQRMKVQPEYDNITIDSGAAGGSYYKVGKSGLYGLIDADGNIIIPLEYENISLIKKSKSLYICWYYHKCGIFDVETGKFALPIQFDNIYSCKLFGCYYDEILFIEKSEKRGLFDLRSRHILPAEFDGFINIDYIGNYTNGYIITIKNNHYGIFSFKTFSEIVPPLFEYLQIPDFSDHSFNIYYNSLFNTSLKNQ